MLKLWSVFLWNKLRYLNALSWFIYWLWSCLSDKTDSNVLEKSLYHDYTKQIIQNILLIETLINFCTNRQCTTSGPIKINLFLENIFLLTAAFSIIHLAPIPQVNPFPKTHEYSHCILTWCILLLKPMKHTIQSVINLLAHFFWEPLLELIFPSRLAHLWQDKTNFQWCKDRARTGKKRSLLLLNYMYVHLNTCTCVYTIHCCHTLGTTLKGGFNFTNNKQLSSVDGTNESPY